MRRLATFPGSADGALYLGAFLDIPGTPKKFNMLSQHPSRKNFSFTKYIQDLTTMMILG